MENDKRPVIIAVGSARIGESKFKASVMDRQRLHDRMWRIGASTDLESIIKQCHSMCIPGPSLFTSPRRVF
jgi:hypothetical protein